MRAIAAKADLAPTANMAERNTRINVIVVTDWYGAEILCRAAVFDAMRQDLILSSNSVRMFF